MTVVELVVAVRDEESTLADFVKVVRELPVPEGFALRMIFVEDSSRDGTVETLRRLARKGDVRGFTLHQGSGQGPAIYYGCLQADAEAVIMMDVDGGHPPAVIPRMLEEFQNGAAIVQCRRVTFEGRPAWRRAGSSFFNFVCRPLTGFDFESQNVYFRLVRRDVLRRLLDRPEVWWFLRFHPAVVPGTRFVELPIGATERTRGTSSYSFRRLIRFATDGLACAMSLPRLIALMVAFAAVSLFLAAAGNLVAAIIAMVPVAHLAVRYVQVRRRVVLDRLIGEPIVS